jgi:DNA-binding beta-propeller fold protein YncE
MIRASLIRATTPLAHPSDGHHRRSSGATSWTHTKSKAVLMRSRVFGHFSGLLAGGMLAGSLLVGCTASSEDVRPPPDQFFFPTGLAIDPAQQVLFVANANSELRYDSGAINAVSLDTVDAIVADWLSPARTIPAGCFQDPEQPETLVCDEASFISASVRIGNFATSVAIQDTGNGSGNARLIVPVRGDPSITWIDWNDGELSCEDGASGFSICDDRHRLTLLRDDEELGEIPEEPFRAFADSVGQYAVVTHLTSGIITLVDSPKNGTPVVADALGGLFQPGDSLTAGGSAVAGRLPSAQDNLIYVASRTESRVQILSVDRPSADELPFLVSSNYFFLEAAGGNSGGSADSRGLAFSADGSTMAAINRLPPALLLYDTSIDAENGFPRNEPKAVYDICREASGLVVGEVDGQNLALVSCFREGLLYIIDAEGRRPTDAVVAVGRGPNDVVMSSTRKKAYVTNFLEDTIGVIDLAPGSTRQNREVLRIGEKRL